jgi:HSP20 family protein
MSRTQKQWNDEMRNLARRMNQLMDEWMHARFCGDPEEGWEPFVDVIECRDYFYIFADLAGVRREDIDVSVDRRSVTIAGVRDVPHIAGQTQVHEMQLGRGPFRRTILLPFDAAADRVEVKCRTGLVEIRIAKPDADK